MEEKKTFEKCIELTKLTDLIETYNARQQKIAARSIYKTVQEASGHQPTTASFPTSSKPYPLMLLPPGPPGPAASSSQARQRRAMRSRSSGKVGRSP